MNNPCARQTLPLYLMIMLFYTITYMLMVILPIHMRNVGIGNTQIGFVMGSAAIATMIFRPLAGKIIDNLGSRKVLFFILALFPLIVLGFLLPALPMFGLTQIFMGMMAAFFSTATSVFTVQIFNEKTRGRGLALNSLASVIPTTFGPAIALCLMDWINFEKIVFVFLVIGSVNFFILQSFSPP